MSVICASLCERDVPRLSGHGDLRRPDPEAAGRLSSIRNQAGWAARREGARTEACRHMHVHVQGMCRQAMGRAAGDGLEAIYISRL